MKLFLRRNEPSEKMPGNTLWWCFTDVLCGLAPGVLQFSTPGVCLLIASLWSRKTIFLGSVWMQFTLLMIWAFPSIYSCNKFSNFEMLQYPRKLQTEIWNCFKALRRPNVCVHIFFFETALLCSYGCLWTCYVDQAVCLCLLGTGIRNMGYVLVHIC